MNSRSFYFKHYHLSVLIKIVSVLIFVKSNVGVAIEKPDRDLVDQKYKSPFYNQILVRDFKNYREFLHQNNRILISKNTKNLNLYFITDSSQLAVTQNNKISAYEFLINSKSIKHAVVYKFDIHKKLPANIGYYSKNKIKYFKQGDFNGNCPSDYKTLAARLGSEDILNKIGRFQVENLIDKASCGNIEAKKINHFEEVLTDQFDIKSSSLTKCFNRADVRRFLDQDQFLQSNSMSIMARFLNLMDQISDGKAPLKIKCALPSKESMKLASYNEQSKPPEISINFQNKAFVGQGLVTSENSTKAQNLSQIINHEIFHHGAQQFPLGTNQDCLDENMAVLFDKICDTTNFEKASFPSSSELLKQCVRNSNSLHASLTNSKQTLPSIKGEDSLAVFGEVQVSAIKIDQEQQAQITTHLANTINPETFAAVDPTEIVALANAPLHNVAGVDLSKNYGASQTVQFESKTKESVQKLFSRFENSSNRMVSSLNNAIALTIPQAQAIGLNPAYGKQNIPVPLHHIVTSKYSPEFADKLIQRSDQPLKVQSFAEAERSSSSEVTNLTDKNKLTKTDSLVNDPQLTLAQARNSRMPASVDLKGDAPSVLKSKPGTDGPIPNAQKTASLTGLANKENLHKTTALKSAQISNKASSSPGTSLDNQALQILTAFNHMTGSQYTQIKKLYKDPGFESLLARRGIRITFLNESNQAVRKIGSRENVRYNFTDDGKALTKVESRK